LVLLAGCQDTIDLDPLDDSPVREAEVRPKPISGGTLAIIGNFAVASDPDRDLVHIVDLSTDAVRHTVALAPGEEPGRVVAGTDGLAHVVLRGFGGVATLDLASGAVQARRWLCPDPRGLAYDPADATLHVACADGALVQLDEATGDELARQQLAPDLRDVVVIDGSVHVSRFRDAAIVRADGAPVEMGGVGGRQRHVAWKTFVDPQSGGIAMLHQLADTSDIPIDLQPDEVVDESSVPYGGGGGDFCGPTLSGPAITILTPDSVNTFPLGNSRLTVDAAISPTTGVIALAMPGIEEGRSTIQFADFTCFDEDDDEQPTPAIDTGVQITAVAFTPGGRLVMQSREPAKLLIQDEPGPFSPVQVVALEGESRFDTGHEIFHRATESGLSCASCHPEGTDDGHVWSFEGLGLRRTQALDIGLAHTAPFHWDGEMEDLDMLMSEVLAHRMGGKRQSPARAESFARWLFAQERHPADTGREDPEAVASGAALFGSYGCGTCHGGADLGGPNTESIRGHMLQVPSLRRISLRPPFMHDGRSATLDHAVRDMVRNTTGVTEPPADHVAALVAYLNTL
jgi:mono/diheme cytochrome c family protein